MLSSEDWYYQHKRIRIEKVLDTKSTNLYYKSHHSIVLIAYSDANRNSIIIEISFAGRHSDGGIFQTPRMGRWPEIDGLNLPNPRPLPNDPNKICFLYYFIADKAFPLKKIRREQYKIKYTWSSMLCNSNFY